MRRLLFILLIFVAGCNTGQPEQVKTLHKDTVVQNNTVSNSTTSNTIIKSLKNKNELIGMWASDNKELLTVKISEDSIYYTEHFESYKYMLRNDSIFIKYPDFILAAKVYFITDTLIMESENGKSIFIKLNE